MYSPQLSCSLLFLKSQNQSKLYSVQCTLQCRIVCSRDTGDKWCGYCLLSHRPDQRCLVGVKLLTLTYLLCSVTSLKASTKTWMGEIQAFATEKNIKQMQISIGRIRKRVFLEIHSQKQIFETSLICLKKHCLCCPHLLSRHLKLQKEQRAADDSWSRGTGPADSADSAPPLHCVSN